jgi:protein-L-isoaspartate(D-aspartate) O-methyltransferase
MPNLSQATARQRMVVEQLERRGIADDRVLDVMRRVPRHRFVPAAAQAQSYADSPLSIGHGQTISQPYMVALMVELLRLTGNETVLELGTGSGYETAVLAELAGQVISIERIPYLAGQAQDTLAELGYANCSIIVGDGTLGYLPRAPYQAIVVSAGAPTVPGPLFEQLTEGGRLVIPVGERSVQTLEVVRKQNGKMEQANTCDCMFVPLIGAQGWQN